MRATLTICIITLMALAPGQAELYFQVTVPLGNRPASPSVDDHGGATPSLMNAFVPGLYQIRAGKVWWGRTLLAATGASLAAGIQLDANANQWDREYRRLPSGLPESDYNRYFNTAARRQRWSNRSFVIAGLAYTYNWVDATYRWAGSAANSSAGIRIVDFVAETPAGGLGVGYTMDQGLGNGRAAAIHEGVGKWFASGLASGALGGLVGSGVIYFVAGNSQVHTGPEVVGALSARGRDYSQGFRTGYLEKIRSRRKSAALGGSLVGWLVLISVWVTATG